VVSNRKAFEGRVFVLVLDDLQTRFNRTARTRLAARQFVERYVGANDIVAVVNTSGYGKAMQEGMGKVLSKRGIPHSFTGHHSMSGEAGPMRHE